MGYITNTKIGSTTYPVGSSLYGTCSTAAGTAAKVVTMASFDALVTGVTIHVKMSNANSAGSPTLNVNSTGAKSIMRYGTTAPSTSAKTSWNAGAVVSFTYDGTYWVMNDWLNDDTTYSVATTSSDGLMSSSDKTKLNGIATGATANTGTVTSVAVKMNGETKGTVTTSGTIDLGGVSTNTTSSNPNLFDNPWFTVNQRGATSGSTQPVYIMDRWYFSSGGGSPSWTLSNGVFSTTGATGNVYLIQRFESDLINQLTGKTVTLSYKDGSDVIYSKTGTFPFSASLGNININWATSEYRFTAASGVTMTIKAVKLELGSVSTLVNDGPPDYTTELLKCQRYFWRFSGRLPSNRSTETATVYRTWLQFPVTMRAVPAISNTSFYEATKTIDGYNTTVHGIYLYNSITQNFILTGADLSADL